MPEQGARKIRVPDGKGGWTYVDPGTKAKIDQDKQQQAMQQRQEEDFFKRVGACTEALNQYLRMYAKDHALSPEETIAAVYLENCNNRQFFPEELGGQDQFDKICADVWNWFKQQVAS